MTGKKDQEKCIHFRDIEKRKPENKEHRKEVDRINRLVDKMKTAVSKGMSTDQIMEIYNQLPIEIQREMMENASKKRF